MTIPVGGSGPGSLVGGLDRDPEVGRLFGTMVPSVQDSDVSFRRFRRPEVDLFLVHGRLPVAPGRGETGGDHGLGVDRKTKRRLSDWTTRERR